MDLGAEGGFVLSAVPGQFGEVAVAIQERTQIVEGRAASVFVSFRRDRIEGFPDQTGHFRRRVRRLHSVAPEKTDRSESILRSCVHACETGVRVIYIIFIIFQMMCIRSNQNNSQPYEFAR